MATIDPQDLGAAHLGRILDVSWQPQLRGKPIRTGLRGALVHVAHSDRGSTLSLDLGALEVTLNPLDLHSSTVDLTDD
jgi:hypothetical protein